MASKKTNTKNILLVIGILLAIIYIFPFYIILVNSFKTQKGIFLDVIGFPRKTFFRPQNYIDAFKQLRFLHSFTNSILITISSTILIVLLGSMGSWMLARTRTKLSSFIFFIFAAAMLIPFQSVMLPLVNIMGKIGFLNPFGLVFMYIGFGSSLSIILYHGFIKSIPYELEEAATIDGCNPWQKFWRVVFPLLHNITITISILNVMWIWNDFLLPQLVINKPQWHTIPLKMFYFFGQYSKRWDLALAGLVISIIPVVVFYIVTQKYIVRSITMGAIK
ncbi:carbohydrate ABC transporter permease [Xylanivirga thermophila]|uniref:carbohydrate ABC transporter permease n=1 Tax=Xylanivirga thermophila TaxID=2496273 RepID=UPI00101CEF71|nr:carbohydrate ABC transporter permease [Xylanivirga thermophila]